ncbi:hypothetical protein [Massilia sp. Leaf139]|uniref:hypothetical protein n=1 Tax=Massilia sp. Leaf139 TaxID=1736272 RepID=UPI0006FDA54A|nr:hypothetical protein [Massilia sp. Leaf139]KQQ97213.1 hypothetical protein ASF77_04450 [Massilia sp. Leaf139]
MPEISGKTLALAVQAIDAEIRRLRTLPDDRVVPGDEELLLQYEIAADDLEDVYAEAAKSIVNLPPYERLVQRDDE